ncbi:AMP-binding protein [Vibrio sp. WXL210]|uniref:AMP-binding protein n=1 Tax=Vibrio sp. WXL210 TaxID=3450709 RepID=UPI003EC90E14
MPNARLSQCNDTIRLTTAQVLRFIKHTALIELAELRHQPLDWHDNLSWPDDKPLNQLGIDSLELTAIVVRITTALQLTQFTRIPNLSGRMSLNQWAQAIVEVTNGDFTQFGFYSSGTTGRKKLIVHQASKLILELEEIVRQVQGLQRIVSLVPNCHLYGFMFSLLLPERVGASLVEAQHLPVNYLTRCLQAGDGLISFPDKLEAWLPHLDCPLEPITIVSSTAPLAYQIKQSLTRWQCSAIFDFYGCAEAGAIAVSKYPNTGYQLLPYWQVNFDKHCLIHTQLQGQEFALPDLLTIDDCRQLSLNGRADQQVQVAGINVCLSEVAEHLDRHPKVETSSVRLMTKEEGNRLKAFIVLKSKYRHEVLSQELETWCQTLAPVQRPKSFVFGSKLPKNELGKLKDWMVEI